MLAEYRFFEDSNYIEAILWVAIGAVFAIQAARLPAQRAQCLVATLAFCLFGVSDAVEAHTGAWWRPWWLLVWKASCLGVFAWLLYQRWQSQRSAAQANAKARPSPPEAANQDPGNS